MAVVYPWWRALISASVSITDLTFRKRLLVVLFVDIKERGVALDEGLLRWLLLLINKIRGSSIVPGWYYTYIWYK